MSKIHLILFAELFTIIYTAPKLGHPLYEPLTYEAAIFGKKGALPSISNQAIRRFLRLPDKFDNTAKKPCLGYDYDDKLCKLLSDRIVCGYNKNLGQPLDAETVDLGNGCFIRRNRVECGYAITPYLSSRRPPTMNEDVINEAATSLKTTEDATTKASTPKPSLTTNKSTSTTVFSTKETTTISITSTLSTNRASTIKTTTENIVPLKKSATTIPMKTTNPDIVEQNTTSNKPRLTCIDKDNSIFCYEINEVK